jgi:hypothetical protein
MSSAHCHSCCHGQRWYPKQCYELYIKNLNVCSQRMLYLEQRAHSACLDSGDVHSKVYAATAAVVHGTVLSATAFCDSDYNNIA